MPIQLDIADATLGLAKLENIATSRIMGRTTAGSGAPEALTAAQATALLNAFSSSLKGLVPASGGNADHVLHADGSWSEAGGVPDDLDIGGTGTGADPLVLKGASVGFITAKSQGVLADGSDERATFRAALTSAYTLGAALQLGEGTIVCGRDGSNAWCIDVDRVDNITITGVKGKSRIRQPAGMPNSQVPLFRFNGCKHITIRDVDFDGNWGNGVAVINEDSDGAALPQATINFYDTSMLPSSGTVDIIIGAGNSQTITYSGKTSTTLTGCTGGTGTLREGMLAGILDDNTGGNHTTQADPKNHLLMFRGCEHVLVENCNLEDAYGDFIWFGYRGDPAEDTERPCRHVRIIGCTGRVSARSGIAIGQAIDGLTVRDCDFRYVFAGAFDTEPQTNNQAARNVLLDHNYFGLWWNPGNDARHINQSVSITGGNVIGLFDANAAQNYRLVNNTIEGSLGISGARGVVVMCNRFITDWDQGATGGYSESPIFVDHTCDDISIIENDIYDRGKYENGYTESVSRHGGAITIISYGLLQPASIRVLRNRIRARNGRDGIRLSGVGSYAMSSAAWRVGAKSYTATGVTQSTVTVTGAGWTTDEWAGYNVRLSAAHAVVVSNTSDTLTLAQRNGTGSGWNEPTGGRGSTVATPSPGAFTLSVPSGEVVVEGNIIDLTDDGHGQGRYGVAYYAEQSGGRISLRNNFIKNADEYGIWCSLNDQAEVAFLEVVENTGHDHQPTPTCLSTVHFTDPNDSDPLDYAPLKLIIRGNKKTGGVAKVMTGITSGVWLEEDGEPQRWAGWGDPENVIAAPVGSQYRRIDGGAGTCLYVKEAHGTAINVTAGAGSTSVSVASGATSSIIPGDTTTVDACLIVIAFAAQPGSGAGDFDNWTNAALTNITERVNTNLAGCIGVITATKAVAGAFGATTVRNNGAATIFGPAAITIALTPEAPGVVPTYQAVGTRQTSNINATVTVPWPDSADVQEGDYGLLFVEILEPDTVSLSTPAGFTEITDSPQLGTYTSQGTQLRIYECRATRPAMTSPQIDFTAGGSPSHIQAQILTFRGAKLSNAVGWDGK